MLLSLLEEFIPPVLQLHGDLFNVAGMFDGSGFNVSSILITQFRVWQLRDGMTGVVLDALAKHLQDFYGGTQFGGRGCLHELECVKARFRVTARDMDWFIFTLQVKQFFWGHLVRFSHKMKTGFWHTVLRGHGQDAIQFEERQGIL